MMGFSLNALAQVIPSGLSFMGLNQNQWLIYVEKSGIFTELPAISEPRNPSFNYKSQKYAYIGSDASLHEASYLDSADSILKLAGKGHAYTQPAYDEDGKRLFLVSLKEGASVDTDILVRENGQWKIAVNQRSAQFEPYFQPPNTLYYSNVHCTEDCGRIIQEIWRKDLTSGIAEQVTLTNSIARQPVVSKDGETLYFSSNKAGYYHIWQLSLASNTYRQLTSGAVTDESPALDSEGHLYFIRHSADGRGGIMQWQDGAEPIELTLPEGVTDVRDLKIRQ
ncbi:TolB family protein [Methylomonas methanica]|nr:PD40 domain-containing protein [Methylomonas methanica]